MFVFCLIKRRERMAESVRTGDVGGRQEVFDFGEMKRKSHVKDHVTQW